MYFQIQANVSQEESEAYSKAGSVAEEVFSAIRTVVSLGGERKEIQRYALDISVIKDFRLQEL